MTTKSREGQPNPDAAIVEAALEKRVPKISAEKPCDCKSYNRPELGGSDAEVVLNAPDWSSKKHICVDACLAPIILELWRDGVITRGCCCGHNGKLGRPSICVDPGYVIQAEAVLTSLGYDADILSFV